MPSCDLCSASVPATARRVSPADFSRAVSRRLRPSGVAAALADFMGLPTSEVHAGWLQMVQSSETDWVLCPSCSMRTDDHLDKKVVEVLVVGANDEVSASTS